ncbi:glycosyltransferase family 87 protein [Janibacter anophelis]|uniref:glycosyltransferase family 87 protein n=1 Tax=Janibacter anophelis TaxID=319054 RepID=UPI00082EBE26|nr:glycosyltransferase family 87 protein [Janibacter anophelis]
MTPQRADRDPLGLALLAAAIGLLLLVGASGTSVAVPPLGPDGWAPPSLPWRLGGWTVVALQTTGYVLGGLSLWRHVRRPTPLRLRWWQLALLAALVLLTAPFGTADHTNYAAYGRILVEGGDPWSVVPADWRGGTDPVVDRVQHPWREATSVYGPVGTWLMGLAAWLGGEVARQVVWVWQVLVVAAWLGTRELLVRLGTHRPTVDRWWTTNVLVLGAGVLGAHVDTLAVCAMAAALGLGLAHRPLLAGLATGLAASTKLTAGVVGVALLWALLARSQNAHLPGEMRAPSAQDAHPPGEMRAPSAQDAHPPGEMRGGWRSRRPAASAVAPALRLIGGTLLVLVPAHLLIGAHALRRITEAGGGISYAMPWRAVYTALDLATSEPVARTATTWLAAGGCVLLAIALWRLTDGLTEVVAVRALFVLTTAYSLGAGYVLPWYELPQWLATAVLLGLLSAEGWRRFRPLLLLLVARSTVLALAYVPGRVQLPDDVETVTLGFRFVASPLATLAVWVALAVMYRRARTVWSGVTARP